MATEQGTRMRKGLQQLHRAVENAGNRIASSAIARRRVVAVRHGDVAHRQNLQTIHQIPMVRLGHPIVAKVMELTRKARTILLHPDLWEVVISQVYQEKQEEDHRDTQVLDHGLLHVIGLAILMPREAAGRGRARKEPGGKEAEVLARVVTALVAVDKEGVNREIIPMATEEGAMATKMMMHIRPLTQRHHQTFTGANANVMEAITAGIIMQAGPSAESAMPGTSTLPKSRRKRPKKIMIIIINLTTMHQRAEEEGEANRTLRGMIPSDTFAVVQAPWSITATASSATWAWAHSAGWFNAKSFVRVVLLAVGDLDLAIAIGNSTMRVILIMETMVVRTVQLPSRLCAM